MRSLSFDVVVMGAGTAGAAAARCLAQGGRSVALLDARALDGAGARWVNGVPPWMFDAAGVPRPSPPERRGEGAFVMRGAHGDRGLRLDPSPVWPVDMRHLVARLHADAEAAGATTIAPARLLEVRFDHGRPRALHVQAAEGSLALEADLFIDASGMGGALRRRVPALARDCPPVPRAHVCSAAQMVCAVADPDAARAWLRAEGIDEGDTLCRAGVAGGYSISNLTVEGDEVEILTGAIAVPALPSGPDLVERARARHAWIGARRFGGAGAIPLRRPYDRLAAPGVALLGNAACQVFSAHGSGIGVGLLAARMLADAVSGAADPGDGATLWRYQATFQRRVGALLAAYDLFRRASQALAGPDVQRLLEAGLLSEPSYRAGLEQRLPVPDARDLLQTLRGALRAPRLAARMAPTFARLGPAVALYRAYPDAPDARALARWSGRAARLFGERPDVAR